MDELKEAIDRAISSMWERYDEPLSLDDIADAAILSKFYFSRVFRSATGTSPGRFLTAVRLYKAKNLLLETSSTVTDISFQVGFNSLGTFTTRFTYSVGVSPARFRHLAHQGLPPPRVPETDERGQTGTVHGTVVLPSSDTPLRMYVGAFSSPIVEGVPESCDILTGQAGGCREHGYWLLSVPVGKWFIRAVAVRHIDVDPRPWTRRPLFVGSAPVTVRAARDVTVDVTMRAATRTDLPILLALPELDCHLPLSQRQTYWRPELRSEEARVLQFDPSLCETLLRQGGPGTGVGNGRPHTRHARNGQKQYAGGGPSFPWFGANGTLRGGEQPRE
jgi:AraC family transcriptional regulator